MLSNKVDSIDQFFKNFISSPEARRAILFGIPIGFLPFRKELDEKVRDIISRELPIVFTLRANVASFDTKPIPT